MFLLEPPTLQVFQVERRIVHLYMEGHGTVCGRLTVRNKKGFVEDVVVADGPYEFNELSSNVACCRLCYGSCFARARPVALVEGNPIEYGGESTPSVSSASESSEAGSSSD